MRLVPLAQRSDIAHVVGVYAALSVHPDVLAGTVPPGGLAEVADRRAVVHRLPFLAGGQIFLAGEVDGVGVVRVAAHHLVGLADHVGVAIGVGLLGRGFLGGGFRGAASRLVTLAGHVVAAGFLPALQRAVALGRERMAGARLDLHATQAALGLGVLVLFSVRAAGLVAPLQVVVMEARLGRLAAVITGLQTAETGRG